MASTKASNAKTAWQYITGKGDIYSIQAKTAYVGSDPLLFGGVAAVAGQVSIPNGFKPRRAQVVSATKAVRWPICYAENATLWTTPGTAVTLDLLGVDTVFVSSGTLRAERPERTPLLLPSD